jgi:hypothetical protein
LGRGIGLVGVLTGEGDRRGVLVEPGQPQAEDADDFEGDGGEQAGAVGFVQVVSGPSTAVVIEQGGLSGKESRRNNPNTI